MQVNRLYMSMRLGKEFVKLRFFLATQNSDPLVFLYILVYKYQTKTHIYEFIKKTQQLGLNICKWIWCIKHFQYSSTEATWTGI